MTKMAKMQFKRLYGEFRLAHRVASEALVSGRMASAMLTGLEEHYPVIAGIYQQANDCCGTTPAWCRLKAARSLAAFMQQDDSDFVEVDEV